MKAILEFITRPFIGSGIGCYKPIWSIYVFLCNLLSRRQVIEVHGFKMLRKTCGDLPSIVLSGKYEELNTKIFSKLIKEDSIVVDIGAHVGFYTLLARSLGAKVYAFEPEIHHRDGLVENVILNGFNDIIVANRAVSDKSSIMALHKSNFRGAQYTLYPVSDNDECSVVQVVSIDDFFKDIDVMVDVIKADTEGMETSVLMGARNVVSRNDNIKIMLEFSQTHLIKAGSSAKELWDELQSLGFEYIYLLDGEIRRCELQDAIRSSNKFGRDVGTTLICSKHSVDGGMFGGQ